MLSQIERNGTERERRHYCAGCEEYVPSVTGHRSGQGSTPLCGRCSRPTTCDCCLREVPRGLCEVDANDVIICVECGGDVPPGCTIPREEAVCGGRNGWDSCIHRERPLCLIEAALAALPFLEAGISAPRWVVSELRRTADELVESARDRPGDGHGKMYDDPFQDEPSYDAVMAGARDTRVGCELRHVLGAEVSP